MAVTVQDLAEYLRLDELAEAAAGLPLADAVEAANSRVTLYAPDAPPNIRTQAAVMMAAHLWEQPQDERGNVGSAFVKSGARALLGPYRTQRAGVI